MADDALWLLLAYFDSVYRARARRDHTKGRRNRAPEAGGNRDNQECFFGRAFMEGAIVMGFAFSSRSMLPEGRGQATRSF
jgi:hypothetical protein